MFLCDALQFCDWISSMRMRFLATGLATIVIMSTATVFNLYGGKRCLFFQLEFYDAEPVLSCSGIIVFTTPQSDDQ